MTDHIIMNAPNILRPQPAEYLYGPELREAQAANRGKSPNTSYIPGEFLERFEDNISEYEGIVESYRSVGDSTAALILGCRIGIDSLKKSQAGLLTEVRLDLTGRFELDDIGDSQLKNWLIDDHRKFVSIAAERAGELEHAKASFLKRMHGAIDSQGLPLTHQQLEDRLVQVSLGFFNPLSHPTDTRATYSATENKVVVSTAATSEDLIRDTYHELLHAVSGQRDVKEVANGDNTVTNGLLNRRIGLKQPKSKRLWLNEAVTDLVADMLIDKRTNGFNFGSNKHPLVSGGRAGPRHNLHSVTLRAMKKGQYIYNDYKLAALDATEGVPIRTVLKAYFAQDNDSYEPDKRAGTHAERDLQRAIKVAAGVRAVRSVRLIGKAFDEAETTTNETIIDNKTKAAKKQAERIGSKSNSWLPGLVSLRRTHNTRTVRKHTEAYQERITRAKSRKHS